MFCGAEILWNGTEPAMRIRDPLPHRRTRHLTDFREKCQASGRTTRGSAPVCGIQHVLHCPQRIYQFRRRGGLCLRRYTCGKSLN
jgi:hypothetical protein